MKHGRPELPLAGMNRARRGVKNIAMRELGSREFDCGVAVS
jgi:hypothetical protein